MNTMKSKLGAMTKALETFDDYEQSYDDPVARLTPSRILGFAVDTCREIIRSSFIPASRSTTADWVEHKLTVALSSRRHIREFEAVDAIEEEVYYADYCVSAITAYDQYASLSNGWLDEDSIAPSQEALSDAKFLLRVISAYVLDCVEVRPTLDFDGTPGALIDDGTTYISLSFYGNNSYTLFVRNRKTKQTQAKTSSIFDDVEVFHLLKTVNSL